MNLTALNGHLIVALTMAFGMHSSDKLLIASAFAMAGVSYVTNVIDETGQHPARNALFWLTFLIGISTYVYLAIKLMGAS